MEPDARREDRAAPENTEPTLVAVLDGYARAGFDADAFVTEDGQLLCGTCGATVDPVTVHVHSIRRLEGQSDPADMSGVLALVCPHCGARATAVLRFGPEATAGEAAVWAHTQDHRSSDLLPPDATPAESHRERRDG